MSAPFHSALNCGIFGLRRIPRRDVEAGSYTASRRFIVYCNTLRDVGICVRPCPCEPSTRDLSINDETNESGAKERAGGAAFGGWRR